MWYNKGTKTKGEYKKMKTKRTFKEKWAYFKYCVLNLSKVEKIAWSVLSYIVTFILGAVIAYVA